MTDAAVVADSAPVSDAPASGAVINENAPGFNSPLGSQIPPDAQAKPETPAKPASLDDSIDRAIAKSAAKQAEAAKAPEPKADAKVDAKEPPIRGEGGKFAPKTPAADARAADQVTPQAAKPAAAEPVKASFTASDAPSRFSDDAKKEWATAPESVRRETERAIKELTDGFQKYKTGHEQNETLREFHDEAKQSGKELHSVVREYRNMEKLLHANPEAGIETILNRVGLTPRQYAEHILNKTPDQQASQQDAVIRELRQELAGLKQQVGGVTQTLQQQSRDATLTEVNKFAADHPRFEELADAISEELKHGYSLAEAYSRAERLNPAPAAAAKEDTPAASSAAPEPPVQPDKGQKSINGAPSAGSSPAAKKRASKSLDEALDRAFGAVG